MGTRKFGRGPGRFVTGVAAGSLALALAGCGPSGDSGRRDGADSTNNSTNNATAGGYHGGGGYWGWGSRWGSSWGGFVHGGFGASGGHGHGGGGGGE